jgi:hypothetical protein
VHRLVDGDEWLFLCRQQGQISIHGIPREQNFPVHSELDFSAGCVRMFAGLKSSTTNLHCRNFDNAVFTNIASRVK